MLGHPAEGTLPIGPSSLLSVPAGTLPGMTGRFTGWPEQAFDVLLQLEGEPSVAVREKWRKDREQLVRQPMIALLNSVADADPTYEDFSVWGYGTMVWWWQRQFAIVRLHDGVELGVRFDLDGLEVGGGAMFGPLEPFRAAVADESSGPALASVLEDLRGKGFTISGGDLLKRGPRGYPADHPRAELLRYRRLTADRPLGCEDWLHTTETVDRVLAGFGELRPLMSWLADHVGAD